MIKQIEKIIILLSIVLYVSENVMKIVRNVLISRTGCFHRIYAVTHIIMEDKKHDGT